jgi:streptogramin lyase
MSQDFTTRLQLQLREAALRDERRSPLGRRLAGLRHGMPRPAVVTAAALAAALVVAVVVAGGVRWGGETPVATPKVIADFPLADNLGQITSGFGAVWAADSKNLEVLRVDPRTHDVQARIKTGGDTNAFGGDPLLNAGAGAVWAIARAPSNDGGHRAVRIDPATNRVTDRVLLPAAQAPLVFDIQIDQGRPWVITSRGAIGLDPATGRPVSFVRILQPAAEVGPLLSFVHDGELWVLTREGTLDRYDLGSGRRTASEKVPLAGAQIVVPTDDGVIYGVAGGELVLVRDGKEAWRRGLGNTVAPPLVLGGTAWVHASDMASGRDRLIELDVRSGKVRSSTGLPQFGVRGAATVGDDIWLSTPNGRVMIVRPPSG